MPKVFISYACDKSRGETLATKTQQQLEASDIDVFRDVTGLQGGDFWLRKLEEELRTSDVVVLVLSKKVLVSKWVLNEVNLAEELGIPVIPIYAELIQLPLWARHLQVIDFTRDYPWKKLHDAIASRIEENQLLKTSWANHSGKDKFGQYADLQICGVRQRFRLIEPGTFWMGSPRSEVLREPEKVKETRHLVTLSKSYWLADTVCTQKFWKKVIGSNPSNFDNNLNNPVDSLSSIDVEEFLQTLNCINVGVYFCLPTEAQWEYACRAGTNTPFSWGENISPEQVNYDGRAPYTATVSNIGRHREKTVPVRSFNANQWGLYEMHGNVWELCQDTYKKDSGSESVIDPLIDSSDYRVVRGGSWGSSGAGCRSAFRLPVDELSRRSYIGFRLAIVG